MITAPAESNSRHDLECSSYETTPSQNTEANGDIRYAEFSVLVGFSWAVKKRVGVLRLY